VAKQYADATYLQRRVPETAAVLAAAPDALTYALEDAEPMIDLTAYGLRSELAHAFYAAHLLAVRFPSIMGGESGAPTGKTAGEVSVSFTASAVASSEDRPGTTRWGRMFLQQQRIAGAGLRVVG
jgi:hypothetical protein